MPRAYLRIDPNIDETVADLDGFIRLMCAAARQPERGRFRDRALVDRAMGRGKAAKALARGDIVTLEDGRLYVDGWDEWQEGDLTVGDRMRRMRARRASPRRNSPVTPPSPDDPVVTTDAGTTKLDVLDGDGVGRLPPNPPQSGGPRANGTNPRSVAAREREVQQAETKRRKAEATALQLAYHRGEMTEDEYAHRCAELGQAS
jgi:hypothetical protein